MGLEGKTPAQVAKTGYPYESWGDVVRSEMPELELTDEDKMRYRVGRKMRAVRRKSRRSGRSENITSVRGLRR